MKIQKNIFIFLFLITLNNGTTVEGKRFRDSNWGIIPTEYNFQGLFGFHGGGDDLYYEIRTSQGPISGIALYGNKLMRLQTLERLKNVSMQNNTILILAPQISTRGLTADQKKEHMSILTYAIIERKDDFITIYLYNPYMGGNGNKLVFDIEAFENFIMNTTWPQFGAVDASEKGLYYAWEFGFEFYTDDFDFVADKNSDDAKKPTLFSQSQYATPMFTIDLHAKNSFPNLGNWASAQWIAAQNQFGFALDPKKLNPNVLIDNNIVSKRKFEDADYDHIEKILTDAGYPISQPTTTGN